MQMFVLVLNREEFLEPLLEEMLKQNIGGATILESTGMMRVLDGDHNIDDLPVLGVLEDSPFSADDQPTVICSEALFTQLTGQTGYAVVDVQLTADAVTDKTYVGTVTRVSMKGSSSGGTTTYPITIRIDETDGLRPGMNANAEIVVAEASNALVVPNAAVIRGGYVLVTKKSPSAANAVEDMDAPEGYVYVKVETGVSDDSYTQIKSGLQEDDTVAYDTSSVSDDYYSDSDSIW